MVGGGFDGADGDVARIGEEFAGEFPHFLRPGSAEHQRLPVGPDLRDEEQMFNRCLTDENRCLLRKQKDDTDGKRPCVRLHSICETNTESMGIRLEDR